MHPNYAGIYAVLYSLPIWALCLICYFAFDVVMHIGRDQIEGLGYQVAYSAKVGDAGLMIVLLIAATIIQRGAPVPLCFTNGEAQILLLSGIVALGMIVARMTAGFRSSCAMDIYHDVVIAPILIFCAITLSPVVVHSGTLFEKSVVLDLVLIWAILVIYDFRTGRMNQRNWMRTHLNLVLRGE